jgi:hypothetical protein
LARFAAFWNAWSSPPSRVSVQLDADGPALRELRRLEEWREVKTLEDGTRALASVDVPDGVWEQLVSESELVPWYEKLTQ